MIELIRFHLIPVMTAFTVGAFFGVWAWILAERKMDKEAETWKERSARREAWRKHLLRRKLTWRYRRSRCA